jgi:hypothetical protein
MVRQQKDTCHRCWFLTLGRPLPANSDASSGMHVYCTTSTFPKYSHYHLPPPRHVNIGLAGRTLSVVTELQPSTRMQRPHRPVTCESQGRKGGFEDKQCISSEERSTS